jgi:FG-GAP-like repeat
MGGWTRSIRGWTKPASCLSLVLAACLSAAFAAPAGAAPQPPPTFAAQPIKLSIPPLAGPLAAGDFNGDGRVDIATTPPTGGAGSVVVWLATGDPMQPYSRQTPEPVGTNPGPPVAGDFDGDGRDDLAVANVGSDSADDTVSILPGQANGVGPAQAVAVRDQPSQIDTGDLDADGDLDLAVANLGSGVANSSHHVSVLTNDGEGQFDADHRDVGCRATDVAIGDLIDDGNPEIAALCVLPTPTKMVIVDHVSDGSHPVCGTNTGFELATGRFDSDSKDDLAAACATNRFWVLGSAGGFAPLRGPNDTPSQPEDSFRVASNGSGMLSNDAEDMNGDGFDDVIMAMHNTTYDVVIATGDGAARFSPESGLQPGVQVGITYTTTIGLLDVIASDVSDDGKPDLLMAVNNEVWIALNTTPMPGVRTGSASGVGERTATVAGSVNPSTGGATTYQFQYGTTAAYGATTSPLPNDGGTLTGNFDVPVSAVLNGLEPDTVYHYRIAATNGRGRTYGRDRTFRTAAVPPAQGGGGQGSGGQQQQQTPTGGGGSNVDATAPELALSAAGSMKRKDFLKKGVAATAEPNEPSALAFELIGSAKNVRLARAGDVVLAERNLALGAGRRTVTLKLPRKFRRGLSRRFTLTVRATATDAAGNRTVKTKRLRVR